MKFVEHHLTSHHLFHAPHRWFFALLLSPIHAAHLHYMKRYHLRFSHAKKLFFFDMCLVAFLLFLSASSIFWYFYDPTIRDLVGIRVEQTTERITTGEKITYTVSYHNRSDIAMQNAVITFELPKGFIFESLSPDFGSRWKKETHTLNLETLPPGGNGTLTLSGTLFGTPSEEYDTKIKLTYRQENGEDSEYVIARLITAARETPLLVTFESGEALLPQGILPFTLIVQNKGNTPLEGIHIPLPVSPGVSYADIQTKIGNMEENIWSIPSLPSHTSTSLKGNIITKLENTLDTLTLETLPTLTANALQFPQKKISTTLKVLHPNMMANAHFAQEVAKPGDSVDLVFNIKNEGDIPLEDMSVVFPLTPEINKTKLLAEKNGLIRANTFVINKNFEARLTHLEKGSSTNFQISIPLALHQGGTNPTFLLNPEIQAQIPNLKGAIFSQKIQSNEVKIAGNINIIGSIRYYTVEGDQLGRGPLPPQIGKETRYMTSLVVQNTTSEVQEVTVSAKLANGIEWGDKTSVSLGKDATFNSTNRTVTWTVSNLPAQTNAGIHFAILFTPSLSQVGTTPLLVENITVSATDNFTGLRLFDQAKSLDASLPQDMQAQNIGVKVRE